MYCQKPRGAVSFNVCRGVPVYMPSGSLRRLTPHDCTLLHQHTNHGRLAAVTLHHQPGPMSVLLPLATPLNTVLQHLWRKTPLCNTVATASASLACCRECLFGCPAHAETETHHPKPSCPTECGQPGTTHCRLTSLALVILHCFIILCLVPAPSHHTCMHLPHQHGPATRCNSHA